VCRPTTCRACGGTTWAGCGQHVEQVMARVPEGDRCTCTTEERAAAPRPSLLQRLLGR
jgi:hypothetical protein